MSSSATTSKLIMRDNVMLQPGHMAQQLTEYEKQRRARIEMNNMKLKEMGLKRMATSLLVSNKKGKRQNTKATTKIRALGDDEEYRYPYSNNHLSSSSSDEEEIVATDSRIPKSIAPHTSTSSIEIVSNIEAVVALSPGHDSVLPQDPTSISDSLRNIIVQASTSRRVRGPTRGINTERIITSNGGKKPEIEIPREIGAPVGENATRFANWVGIQVRMSAPLKGIEKWSDIPSAIKTPIIQATHDKFHVKNYETEEHVAWHVNNKCQKLYRNWRHKMKRRYQQLVNASQNPYNKPYRDVSQEDWTWMIDNIWTNPDKEEKAKKKREARATLPFNHTMGSQSFAAAMFAETKDKGKRPHVADFFQSSHYNCKKKRWVAPICEKLHAQLNEHRQDVEASSSTDIIAEELTTLEVDGQTWYVKEYGISSKQSSSKRYNGSSREEVQVLKNRVETLSDTCQRQENEVGTLKDLCQSQQDKISAYDEKFDAQAKKIEQLEAFMCAYMQGSRIGTNVSQ